MIHTSFFLSAKAVNFLEQVPLVEEAVIASLSTLGDGNWRMGEGVGKGGKIGTTGIENEKALVGHFIRRSFVNRQINLQHH